MRERAQQERRRLTRCVSYPLPSDGTAVQQNLAPALVLSVTMAMRHVHGMQEAPEVEVEYVSAPHEYEELLQSEPEPSAEAAGTAGLGSSGGGLGFVAAGTSEEGSGPGLGVHLPEMESRPDRDRLLQ